MEKDFYVKDVLTSIFKLGRKNFGVYPNPANNRAIISLPELINGTITLTNIEGKKIQRIDNINDKHYVLDFGNIECGIYIIKISAGNINFYSEKLIISR